MQSPAPAPDDTPFATPLPSAGEDLASPAAGYGPAAVDPLVAHAAAQVADALNLLKRELDKRDAPLVSVHGTLEITLHTDPPQAYELVMVSPPDDAGFLIRVEARLQKGKSPADGEPATSNALSCALSSARQTTRRASDAELERDLVSRKRHRLDGGEDPSPKRLRVADDEDAMPLVAKPRLEDLLIGLREDIQEDTSECVNHVQKLLRRFKEEWHEKSKWDLEHMPDQPVRAPFRNSIAAAAAVAADGITPGASFPSPDVERDDQDVTLPELIRKESRLLSSQVRWVEECRRVAADAHDKREENWRTSSAGFHDRARQDRENFQGRMLHESGMHTQTLNQILNEVRAIGLYTQSMKWETPPSLTAGPAYSHAPVAPAFPTQTPPTMEGTKAKGFRGK